MNTRDEARIRSSGAARLLSIVKEVIRCTDPTLAGLKTNGHGQVLGRDDQPIGGLYAVGTDMASVMGGFYPSGGIALGPAMTFGYIAGRHAAGAAQYEEDFLDNRRWS